MSGKIPKSGGSAVGYQYLPKRKPFTETCLKMGSPSAKRKTTIRTRIVIEARATRRKRNGSPIPFSDVRLASVSFPQRLSINGYQQRSASPANRHLKGKGDGLPDASFHHPESGIANAAFRRASIQRHEADFTHESLALGRVENVVDEVERIPCGPASGEHVTEAG